MLRLVPERLGVMGMDAVVLGQGVGVPGSGGGGDDPVKGIIGPRLERGLGDDAHQREITDGEAAGAGQVFVYPPWLSGQPVDFFEVLQFEKDDGGGQEVAFLDPGTDWVERLAGVGLRSLLS
jgi:hypothetical protein